MRDYGVDESGFHMSSLAPTARVRYVALEKTFETHEIIKQGFKTRLRLKEYHKCKQKHDVLFCAL